MRIGIDVMGGDFAPGAALEGISRGIKHLNAGEKLVLLGDQSVITPYLKDNGLQSGQVEVVHTEQVIEMGESPTKAIAKKPDSSIAVGFKLLKEEKIDVFIGAGNTGAMFVGAFYSIKAIPGIMRPAITSIVPKEDGGYGIFLDVGANADCKPEVLDQFGLLGSIYAKYVYKIPEPKVALLNIGSEKEKGNLLTQSAYQIMEKNPTINFIGNIEGYDMFNNKADVIVCDGFTGNIVLKFGETMYQMMKKRGYTDEYFEKFDYEHYGGTPILGVNAPVIIGHGVSTSYAFESMIKLGRSIHRSGLINHFKSAFDLKKAE
jgi:phosphate acyltransferase